MITQFLRRQFIEELNTTTEKKRIKLPGHIPCTQYNKIYTHTHARVSKRKLGCSTSHNKQS